MIRAAASSKLGPYRQPLDQPAPARHGDDPVALAHALDAFAHGLDHAGDLGSRREGPLGPELIFVLDDQGVGIVDPHRLDLDDHLARLWRRVEHVLHDQGFGATRRLGQNSAHLSSLADMARPSSRR